MRRVHASPRRVPSSVSLASARRTTGGRNTCLLLPRRLADVIGTAQAVRGPPDISRFTLRFVALRLHVPRLIQDRYLNQPGSGDRFHAVMIDRDLPRLRKAARRPRSPGRARVASPRFAAGCSRSSRMQTSKRPTCARSQPMIRVRSWPSSPEAPSSTTRSARRSLDLAQRRRHLPRPTRWSHAGSGQARSV